MGWAVLVPLAGHERFGALCLEQEQESQSSAVRAPCEDPRVYLCSVTDMLCISPIPPSGGKRGESEGGNSCKLPGMVVPVS